VLSRGGGGQLEENKIMRFIYNFELNRNNALKKDLSASLVFFFLLYKKVKNTNTKF
jgi:hypothetical protein